MIAVPAPADWRMDPMRVESTPPPSARTPASMGHAGGGGVTVTLAGAVGAGAGRGVCRV